MNEELHKEEELLLDGTLVDLDFVELQLNNWKRKRPYIFICQFFFFCIGFFLVSNTLILYGLTYGRYYWEDHLLQFFLFLLGVTILNLSFLFRRYNKGAKELYATDQKALVAYLMDVDFRIWRMAGITAFLFFVLIIMVAFLAMFIGLGATFWIFLDA